LPRKGTPSGKPFIWISLEEAPAAVSFNASAGVVRVPEIVPRPSDAAAAAGGGGGGGGVGGGGGGGDADDDDDDDDDDANDDDDDDDGGGGGAGAGGAAAAAFALGSDSIGASSFCCTYTNDGSVPNTRGFMVS
jgi:hypothetical protein